MKNDASDRIISIKWKIFGWMTSCVIFMLMLVSIIVYKKITKLNEENYDDKIENVLATYDASIDNFYSNIETLTKIFASNSLIREANNNITSYVNKSAPGGKVPMEVDQFSDYERKVYELAKSFVDQSEAIMGISVALESNGGFVRYPEEPRSNNYDSRQRSWYKNAKAKNGMVNISDAYVASAGYKTIVYSVYFNDEYGNPRGVVSVDANIDYLNNLLSVTQKNDGKDEYYILLAKDGTIIINQVDESTEFKKIQEIGISDFENYQHGDDVWFEDQVNGERYEFWCWPTNSKYLEGDYIAVIPIKQVYAADHAILFTVTWVTLFAIIVSTTIALILGYNIVTPLKQTADLLKNISEGEGDLTQRLPVKRRNEITLVAKYFNATMEKMQGTVKTVINETASMESGAVELGNNMAETASALNQITSNIASIKTEIINQSAGVEETSATINQISDNITKLTNNIEVQAASVAQSSSAVEEMVANIRSVSDILDKNQAAVEELTNSAEKGKTVVSKTVELTEKIENDSEGLLEASAVIQNIASQTNLLAMNAAIEAAHAGEVGKGFSVVADEIRKLAEDSSIQGKRITEALKELKDTINNVTGASHEIKDQFNVIFENTQRVSQQEAVIKSAMDEQTAGSQQILTAMQDINDITGQVKAGAALMEQGGKEIAVEMDKLSQVTLEISGSMNEMNTGVTEINNAMQLANNMTIKNNDSIKAVAAEIGKFKVE